MTMSYRVTLDDLGSWELESVTVEDGKETVAPIDQGTNLGAWSVKAGRTDRLTEYARNCLGVLPVKGEPIISSGMYADAEGWTRSVLTFTWRIDDNY